MPDEAEMEILIEKLTGCFGHDIIKHTERGNPYERDSEQVQIMGALAERSSSGSMDCQDILEG